MMDDLATHFVVSRDDQVTCFAPQSVCNCELGSTAVTFHRHVVWCTRIPHTKYIAPLLNIQAASGCGVWNGAQPSSGLPCSFQNFGLIWWLLCNDHFQSQYGSSVFGFCCCQLTGCHDLPMVQPVKLTVFHQRRRDARCAHLRFLKIDWCHLNWVVDSGTPMLDGI